MKVEEHVPASSLTTFRVGGSVRRVVTIETFNEVEAVVHHAQSFGLPVVPFGSGSNVLLPDGLLDVTLLRYEPKHIIRSGNRLHVDAGALWNDVVTHAVQEKLWGIENLSAIPGTMGGAVVQNIGAYGAVLSQSLILVSAYDVFEKRIKTLHVSDCAFGYRQSLFKIKRDRYVVLSAQLELTEAYAPNTSYADLAQIFKGRLPTLADISNEVCGVRARKFPPLHTVGSAGSYFLNPVVTDEHAFGLQKSFPGMPIFKLPEGGVKIPLGWYFEHILKIRGHREGNVEAWREQALVIAAHDGATAHEVKQFVKKISDHAQQELGLQIVPEVREF